MKLKLKSLFSFGKISKESKPTSSEASFENNNGIIGEYYENNLPVIVKFVNELPDAVTRSKLPILTVISWKYDGNENNGMPQNEINSKMITLESTIENSVADHKIFKHAYSRTGNNLKEFIYYSSSQDAFMKYLNNALTNHERFPIEIDFYEDKEWNELRKLLNDFKTDEQN